MMHDTPNGPRPTDAPGLISDIILHLSRLLDRHAALAKDEISAKINKAGAGLAMIAVAAVLALAALDVLAAAAVAALVSAGLSVALASLIVGGAVLTLAVVLVVIGKERLKLESLTPERSIAYLRKDIQSIKEKARV